MKHKNSSLFRVLYIDKEKKVLMTLTLDLNPQLYSLHFIGTSSIINNLTENTLSPHQSGTSKSDLGGMEKCDQNPKQRML